VFAAGDRHAIEGAMNSTRPLAKTGSDVERLLLAAGAGERPDAESVRKTARALGIVPRAALIAATLGVALRASKWTSVAAWSSLSLVGVAGVVLVTHTEPSTSHAGVAWTAPHSQTPAATAASSPPASVAASPAAPVASWPAAWVASSPPASLAAPPALPEVPPANRLRDEARSLDSVRARLALGDATGALARLGDYDRRFPDGSLREEALLLQIESLARDGDRSTAAALARRFLAAYPTSVHVARVEAVLRELTASRAP
jgi:hypothetical protein